MQLERIDKSLILRVAYLYISRALRQEYIFKLEATLLTQKDLHISSSIIQIRALCLEKRYIVYVRLVAKLCNENHVCLTVIRLTGLIKVIKSHTSFASAHKCRLLIEALRANYDAF